MLFCGLAFALFCAHLCAFACFCVRPRLERPRLGTEDLKFSTAEQGLNIFADISDHVFELSVRRFVLEFKEISGQSHSAEVAP